MAHKQYSTWTFLFTGIIIGIFISFIIYLQKLPDAEPATAVTPAAATHAQIQAEKPQKTAKEARANKPRFDFYKILPELEVIVPSLEVIPDKPGRKPAKSSLPEPTATLKQGEKFILQAGSFKDINEADKLKANLALLGTEATIQKITVDHDTWHRVRLGPFTDTHKLNEARQRLKENGIQAITLKINN